MNTDQLKFDNDGLIPAIIQDISSRQVLMLGYMNRETIKITIDTGLVTFYSRSRKQNWVKGETSGNTLELVDLQKDCDSDALLIFVRPAGPTCHTGNTSCFFETELPEGESVNFLIRLEDLLRKRKKEMPEGSYTSTMFAKGLDKISQKVGEEAVETVIAAKNDSKPEFIYEASDLLFHLMLLMVQKDIPFTSLIEELRRRHLLK